MKLTSQLILVFGLLAFGACGSGKSKFELLADKICDCTGDACADSVRKEYEKVYLNWTIASMGTNEQGQRDGKAFIRASDCMKRL